MKKVLFIPFLLIGITSFVSAQYVQYGNGTNPPAGFAAHPDDLAGLEALYNALDGPNWNIPNHIRWKMTPLGPDGITPFFYHKWYMVHFKPNHRVGRIKLWTGDGASGAIPPEISMLSELEMLEIEGNNITDISEVRNLPNLKTLVIQDCNLQGQIPCIVDDLPSLVFLDLSKNQLSGSLPECLAGPNSVLESISIRENNLTGCIPENYDRFCSDLNRIFYFDDNVFDNTITDVCNNVFCDDCPQDYPILWDFYQSTGGPNWTTIATSTVTVGAINVPALLIWWENLYFQFGFTDWQGIQSIIEFQPLFPDIDFPFLINLYLNNPTLVDPGSAAIVTDAWFEDCDPCGIQDGSPWKGIICNGSGEITHINLNSSNLVGTIPSSLSGLTSLQSLNLGNNQLSGIIPSTYASLTNLQIWNMESNGFSGQFPSFLVDFDYLQYLHLGNNNLSGSLPLDFSNLTYLKEFRVNDNQLSGSLTNTFGSCTQLIHFDASSNGLNGNLPSSFGGLADLTHIYLDENQFTGEIPGQWGDLQSIIRIDVSQNQLTGTLLDNNLENLCPINTITNYHINDGNNIDELWSMMCHCVSTDYPTFSIYPAAIPGLADPNMPCCQIFTDEVITDGDGNVYTAYRIGNQVWLQENLMTTSCLDGTPLPNYKEYYNQIIFNDPNADIPIWAPPTNVTGGIPGGTNEPYGYFYSHYLFSSLHPANTQGQYTYSQYSDGSLCQVCPDGFRIANAPDFYYLKTFLDLAGKDIYDVSESCFNPVGGGHGSIGSLNTVTNPYSGQSVTGVYVSTSFVDHIWVSSQYITYGNNATYTQPYDIHIDPSYGILTNGLGNGYHLLGGKSLYRTLRCIKQ